MSSINTHFTFNYSQPEEYHFSHDSVFLARRTFEMMKDKPLKALRGLDLCAGCGVIGLDFIFHCQQELGVTPQSFDFFEVQNIYETHFKENVQRSGITSTKCSFVQKNYAELLQESNHGPYDLILCNPPYFRVGQGKLSPSEFKNRCRFFMDSDFKTLLEAIKKSLSSEGVAYLLLRDLDDHGWKPEAEAREILEPEMQIQKLDDIRGTGLLAIKRNAR